MENKGLTNEEKDQEQKRLSGILAYNYLAKRFRSDPRIQESLKVINDGHKKVEDDFKRKEDYKEELKFKPIEKVIVIVGAGASLEAGLMLGGEAKENLLKMVTTDSENTNIKIDEKIIIKELRKNLMNKGSLELSVAKGSEVLKHADFETVIETLSQFKVVGKQIRKRLRELFSARHNPILTYEIIAHMLKYHMIDGVINFNFDELLDQSIEEELIHENYIKVIGGNDFSDYEKRKKEILSLIKKEKSSHYNLRYYIKPHGTFSDEESLRSTKPSYINNSGFNEIMKTELTGHIAFVIIGFDMDSVELNSIISRNIQRRELTPQFYFIKPQPKENPKEFLREKLFLKNNSKNKDSFSLAIESLFPYQQDYIKDEDICIKKRDFKNLVKHNLITSEIMSNLFKKTSNLLDEFIPIESESSNNILTYPIKDIERHIVITNLFSNLGIIQKQKEGKINTDDHFLYESYFYIRVLLEIMIAIAKGKTIINVIGLSKGRVGELYRLYCKNSNEPKSLYEICKKFDLIAPTYSKEVLMVKKKDNPYRNNEKECESDENVNKKISNYIVKNLLVKFNNEIQNTIAEKRRILKFEEKKYTSSSSKSLNTKESFNELSEISLGIDFLYRFLEVFNTQKRKDNLIKYIESLFFAETEMGHQFPTGNHLMYGENSSMEIYNMSQLNFHINAMLKKTEQYDSILISLHIPYEEWIKFIKDYRNKAKKITIIYENSPVNIFAKKNKDLEHINAKELNWWQHKRSAFLFLDKNHTPVYSSYYYHGTKNQAISPIIIDNTRNKTDYKKNFLEDTFQIFLAYMVKTSDKDVPNLFSDEEEVNLLKDDKGNIDKKKVESIFKSFGEN